VRVGSHPDQVLNALHPWGCLAKRRDFDSAAQVHAVHDLLTLVADHFQVGYADVASFSRLLLFVLLGLTLLLLG
jgi:hypothetical protein